MPTHQTSCYGPKTKQADPRGAAHHSSYRPSISEQNSVEVDPSTVLVQHSYIQGELHKRSRWLHLQITFVKVFRVSFHLAPSTNHAAPG